MDRVTEIDIEIEACELAIYDSFWVEEVARLELRIKELIKERRKLIKDGLQ